MGIFDLIHRFLPFRESYFGPLGKRGTPPKNRRGRRSFDQIVASQTPGRMTRKIQRGYVAPVEVKPERKALYLHSVVRKKMLRREHKNRLARARRAARKNAA